MCTHPPRQWYLGMLLPCADWNCGRVAGDNLVVPIVRYGQPMLKVYFERIYHMSELGNKIYEWRYASESEFK